MDRSATIRMRQLEVFTEVARLQSVSRAAQSLNMTQPGVTRTLRDLEAVCGHPLFAKEGRGIAITPHGAVFLRHAGGSLAAIRNGLAALNEFAGGDGPPLRIGALPTVSATLMPQAVAGYLDSGVGDRLMIVTGENRVLLDQLRRSELDLVIGRLPAPELMVGLRFEPLYRDRIAFVVECQHPLAAASRVTSDDLQNYPVIMPTRNAIIRPVVERLFIEKGYAIPLRAVESVSDSFGREFVRRNRAIWIISRGVVASEIERGEFAELPVDTQTTLGSVGLNQRVDAEARPSVELFASIVRRLTT